MLSHEGNLERNVIESYRREQCVGGGGGCGWVEKCVKQWENVRGDGNQESEGRSRRCNFTPWDKGQCPHGALFHAVPGCCKCFQQCRIAPKCSNSRSPSYPTLLEALATPWHSVEQCSMGTLSLDPSSKVASSGQIFRQMLGTIELPVSRCLEG